MELSREFGDFELLEVLGEGGMGIVYRARQKSLERDVAIKFFPMDRGEELKERFLREARIAAKINHPGIVSIYNVGLWEGERPYFVMEYVEGRSLQEVLEKKGRVSYDVAVELCIQVAEILDFAHSQGIIHRDIKPANIMITKTGYVKILDFGLAKVKTSLSHLTTDGIILGTPYYMAPEQVQGQKVDERSDLYALGVVLYEMTTGKKPFDGEHAQVILYKHVYEPFPQPTSWIPTYPPPLEQILLRCVEKEPDRRFPSAKTLLYALQSLPKPLEERRRPDSTLLLRRDPPSEEPSSEEEAKPPQRKKPISRELRKLQLQVHQDTIVLRERGKKKYRLLLWLLWLLFLVGIGVVLYLGYRRGIWFS